MAQPVILQLKGGEKSEDARGRQKECTLLPGHDVQSPSPQGRRQNAPERGFGYLSHPHLNREGEGQAPEHEGIKSRGVKSPL